MKNKYIFCLLLLTFLNVNSQPINNDNKNNLELLIDFLSIPNNSSNKDHIAKNLDWLQKQFATIEFNSTIISESNVNYFFAEKKYSNDLPTVLFYMHFDGQPVDSEKWFQPNPYTPVLKLKDNELQDKTVSLDYALKHFDSNDIRIYARSASDDKGPIVMLLSALKMLNAKEKTAAYNIKIILDSEEEKGSPNILKMVEQNANILSADYFVVFDGPMHDSANPTLLYGVRGISALRMEIYGMSKPQHSGHYGNYGPNPVFRTAQLLSSMKDDSGRVLIEGFYDGITISDETQRILDNVPDDETVLRKRAGFKTPESVGDTYQAAMQFPSLNVRGIQSAWVGEQVRTVVPDKTIIEMDIRTVPESKPEILIQKIKKHIEKQGFTILTEPAQQKDLLTIEKPLYLVEKHYMFPFRTAIQSKIGDWLRSAVKKDNTETVEIRISGGSVPLSFFINELNLPTVLVPLVNPDNNQHSPNENLKLSNYFEGIATIESILSTPID
nr:M20/M25/M40 family metallo-hydrolase [uncultured Psychroserpens sp.]